MINIYVKNKMEETWKTLEDYPNYEFSSQNRLRNKEKNTFLKLDSDNCFTLSKNGKRTKKALSTLNNKYFPKPIKYLEGEIFKTLEDYPNYEFSNHNRLRNKEKNTFLKPTNNSFTLHKNGKKKGIALSTLNNKYFPEELLKDENVELLPRKDIFLPQDGEIFKVIEGIPLMKISNFGRIYSVYSSIFWDTSKNYVSLNIWDTSKKDLELIGRKFFVVSKLVAQYFIPNPDNFDIVIHIDNDKSNNHYTNLKWIKKCPCGRKPSFGYKERVCCYECKKPNMINLSKI